MVLKLFPRFNQEVDITDRRQVHYLRKRLVPFSQSPFKDRDDIWFQSTVPIGTDASGAPGSSTPRSTSFPVPSSRLLKKQREDSSTFVDPLPDKYDDKPVGERPPFWLELSGDLAWTAAFASLTNNKKIAAPGDIVNYAVFFMLTWQLWASQAAYETKYYTNDWWHRCFFALQLLAYGSLAAFTADFDIFWFLHDHSSDIFTDNVSALTGATMIQRVEREKELCFMGVAITIAFNRALLLTQYLRIYYYRHRHRYGSWQYRIKPLSIAVSCLMFFGCFLMLRFGSLTRTTTIIQFALWGSAMTGEILGHAFSPNDEQETLRSVGSISNRLSTFTVIVMGEGLNSICSVLQSTVNAVGAGVGMAAIIASLAFTLYFLWLCYFDGFRERLPPLKTAREMWFILHLPFHLFLILVLEGLKTMLLQSNLVISLQHMEKALTAIGFSKATPESRLATDFAKLDISWSQVQIDSAAAATQGQNATDIWYQRLAMMINYRIHEQYQDIDHKTEFLYKEFLKNDNIVLNDLTTVRTQGRWGPAFMEIITRLEEPLYNATTFLVPMAGFVMLFIGVLNYVQRRPKDRYEWGAVLNKVIAGMVLVVLVQVNISKEKAGDLGASVWRLPTLAIVLGAVTFVDGILLKFSVRSVNRLEAGWARRPISLINTTYRRVSDDSEDIVPLREKSSMTGDTHAREYRRSSLGQVSVAETITEEDQSISPTEGAPKLDLYDPWTRQAR